MYQDVIGIIYCKECPNSYYLEHTNAYYCEKYAVEIEDISRDYCEIETE